MILGYSIYELLWLFFIYAFFGWCIEVVFCGLNEGHFINRGFLNGPVCPIYGVGGVIVVLCLTPIKDNLFFTFRRLGVAYVNIGTDYRFCTRQNIPRTLVGLYGYAV